MCAIVDAQVAHEVFGEHRFPAGREFYRWLHKGRGRLVTGGELLKELETGSPDFRQWAREAGLAGLMTVVNEEKVKERATEIERDAKHASNDPHVLALAQISGARLLFTNDELLQHDFRSTSLINGQCAQAVVERQALVPPATSSTPALSATRLLPPSRARRRAHVLPADLAHVPGAYRAALLAQFELDLVEADVERAGHAEGSLTLPYRLHKNGRPGHLEAVYVEPAFVLLPRIHRRQPVHGFAHGWRLPRHVLRASQGDEVGA